jgi:Alkylmercury lyase
MNLYPRVVTDDDVALRNLTYRLFVELGRAPTVDDVAAAGDSTTDEVWAGWTRLHDAHALVLETSTRELRMANPFSAVPTAFRVHADGRWWYTNCAWDAFGICAALHTDGTIETSCADCGDPIEVEVRAQHPDDESLLFHCLVDAAHWWDDIVFT